MHITLEADYAIRMVYKLALSGTRTEAKALSEELGVPPRYCLKIMRRLVAAGMVRSYQGSGGGYELAVPPSAISVRRIIEQIDGPIAISRCLGDAYTCTRVQDRDTCTFHRLFAALSHDTATRLDRITMDLVINPACSDEDLIRLVRSSIQETNKTTTKERK